MNSPVAAPTPAADPEERPVLTAADLVHLEQEVAEDGVYVDPAFARAHQLTAADEQAIEQAVASGHREVRVVLVRPSYDDPEFQGDARSVATWLHAQDDHPAVYLVPTSGTGSRVGIGDVNMSGDDRSDGIYAQVVSEAREPDDVTARIVEQIDLLQLDSTSLRDLAEREVPREPSDAGVDPAGGQHAGGVPAWWIAGTLVLVVALLMVAGAGWRAWVRRRSDYLPAPRLLRRAKRAETQGRRHLAESELLALTERIGRADVGVGTELALAHQQAARRLLDRTPGPEPRAEADLVGALVLIGRGVRALTNDGAAPPLSCWFNPLHPAARDEVRWVDGNRQLAVPACRACADAVQHDRTPSDILDLAVNGRTRHWFHLELGVWTRTGFGAFTRDLPGALAETGADS